jgi:FkbM family methyltransferase
MEIHKLITRVAAYIPQPLKTALRGDHGSPNRLANIIHGFLNRLPGDRYPILPCAGRLKGYRMRVDWQIHRAFIYDSWEPEVAQVIDRTVVPGMTVADIGAQSGFYSLLLSKRVGAQGQVIAFEPLPANYRLLEENLRLNKIENVIVCREAVADRNGTLNFQFPSDEPSLIAGPVLAEDETGTFDVPCVSLDDFVAGKPISFDLIKMDVEGAEGSVLAGATKTLQRLHPILIIELHHAGAQPRLHPVPVRLQAMGYSIEWLDERPDTTHILAVWQTSLSCGRSLA